MRLIAPSILAADFAQLGNEIAWLNASEADWIHVDVMDGIFVPNISFGFPIMDSLRRLAEKPLDVHLMITNPDLYVERFCDAGAWSVGFHLEAVENPLPILEKIRAKGVRTCLTINPDIDVNRLLPYLDKVDMILLMSVFAGFGGQKFIPETLDKVSFLRAEMERRGLTNPPVLHADSPVLHADSPSCHRDKTTRPLIEVDGGVNTENAHLLWEAGADVLVTGSSVFHAPNPAQTIIHLKS